MVVAEPPRLRTLSGAVVDRLLGLGIPGGIAPRARRDAKLLGCRRVVRYQLSEACHVQLGRAAEGAPPGVVAPDYLLRERSVQVDSQVHRPAGAERVGNLVPQLTDGGAGCTRRELLRAAGEITALEDHHAVDRRR